MNGHTPRLLAATALVAFLFLCAGGAEAAKPQTVQGIMSSCEADMKTGLEAVELLLKSTKREKSETVAVWEEINEKNFLKFRSSTIVEFSALLKGKTDPASERALAWAAAMESFVVDLQSVGEVVEQLRKMNVLRDQIEFETEYLFVRMAEFQEELKKIGQILAAVNRDVSAGKLSSASSRETLLEKSDELTRARNMTETVVEAVDAALAAMKDGLAPPQEIDKRIAAILDGWTDVKAKHPDVKGDLTDVPPRWVPLVKNQWNNLLAARKKFDEEASPFFSGGLVRDLPFFGAAGGSGSSYKDVVRPVLELEFRVKGMIEKAKEAEEKRRTDLAKDEELTRGELARIRELERLYGPVREREVVVGLDRAAGGVARKAELQRRIDALGSGFGAKEREELRLLNEWKHPDQIPARDAYAVFYEGRARANEEIWGILKAHTERRRKLGLRPVLDVGAWSSFPAAKRKL